jgi:hypothetical protein
MQNLPALSAAAVALLLSAGGLQAHGTQSAGFLEQWDRSGSGSVSLADMRARRAEIFDMFDSDGSGGLDASEQRAMAATVADRDALRGERRAEAMGSGQADRPGRGRGQQAASAPGALIHAAMAPEFNDANGDGIVTRAEFLGATDRLFALLDRSGEGRVGPEDLGRGRR